MAVTGGELADRSRCRGSVGGVRPYSRRAGIAGGRRFPGSGGRTALATRRRQQGRGSRGPDWGRALILRGPQVIPAEAGLLDLLTGQSGAGEQASALAEVLLPVFRKHGRIVVFCGSGALAASLAASLRRRIPNGRIGEHTARQNATAGDEAVGQWRERGGILVADDSAEDGLNLQDADAVVHARLPWSPNRLEQRIGRVDRYGEGSGQAARRGPGAPAPVPRCLAPPADGGVRYL